jgi:hypothetical protein
VSRAKTASLAAIVSAVGWPCATSSAKLGPEKAPARRPGSSSCAISWGSFPVARSKPLHAQSTGTSFSCRSTSRSPAVGVATMASREPARHASRLESMVTFAGIAAPGR